MRDAKCRLLVPSYQIQTEKLLVATVIYGKEEVTEFGRRRMSLSVSSTHTNYLQWRYKTIQANRTCNIKLTSYWIAFRLHNSGARVVWG